MENVRKRKTGVLFLVAAIIFALVAAILIVSTLRSYTETKDVVAVVRDIKAFQKLTESDLAIITVPTAAVPSDAVYSLDDVIGSYISTGLLTQTIIRKGHLADVGGSNLAAKLTDSEQNQARAFALPYESVITFGGKIEQGDRIDIVGALTLDGVGPTSKTIAQQVQVLDVINEGEQTAVIIEVEPALAEELVFLLENGKVYASLNPYGITSTGTAGGIYSMDTFSSRHAQ